MFLQINGTYALNCVTILKLLTENLYALMALFLRVTLLSFAIYVTSFLCGFDCVPTRMHVPIVLYLHTVCSKTWLLVFVAYQW